MPIFSVTAAAIATSAFLFVGLVANTVTDARHRRNVRLLGTRVDELESFKFTHISNNRFISAMEKNPFVTAFNEAKLYYEKDQKDRARELAKRQEYDKLTDVVVDRKLAAKVIASIPYDYGRGEKGLSLESLASEYKKYSTHNRSIETDPRAVILGLVTAGYLEKYNYKWTTKELLNHYSSAKREVKHEEVRYRFTSHKKRIIKELNATPPPLREEMARPQIEDFVDIEMAKKWVEEAQVEFLEEELANF